MYFPIIPIKQNYYKLMDRTLIPWENKSTYNLDLESILSFISIGFMLDDDTYFTEIKTLKPATENKINDKNQITAEERILIEFNFQKYISRYVTIERPTNLLRKLFRENGYMLIKGIPKLDCFYVHETFLDEYLENLVSFYKKRHLSIRWNREGNKI